MSPDHVNAIKEMYGAAITEVHAGNAVRRNLELREESTLVIAGKSYAIPPQGAYVIAIGKASLEMCSSAAAVLGDHLISGIVVTKDASSDAPERVKVLVGSHPVPDDRSIQAGHEVLRFAEAIPKGALVLCLISGGGSALVEVPRNGVTLETLRDVTGALLRGGASIQELNAVRSRLSAIKDGGLLRALHLTNVHNLIVSDVLGDDLHAIASGPTVPPASSLDAAAVINTHEIDVTLPPSPQVESTLEPETSIIANVSTAIDAVARHSTSLGYRPFVLTRSVTAEAREVGVTVAGILRDSALGRTSIAAGTCVIAGGETVVTLRGNGVGGRNTEAALAAAIALMGSGSTTVGFLATDGDDGVSGAAGAIVHGQTIPVGEEARARRVLRENDSFPFLHGLEATYVTGPTGTNVNDLIIGVVD